MGPHDLVGLPCDRKPIKTYVNISIWWNPAKLYKKKAPKKKERKRNKGARTKVQARKEPNKRGMDGHKEVKEPLSTQNLQMAFFKLQ
jgi:hypothetical protein